MGLRLKTIIGFSLAITGIFLGTQVSKRFTNHYKSDQIATSPADSSNSEKTTAAPGDDQTAQTPGTNVDGAQAVDDHVPFGLNNQAAENLELAKSDSPNEATKLPIAKKDSKASIELGTGADTPVTETALSESKKIGPECYRAVYGLNNRVTAPLKKKIPEFKNLIQLPDEKNINNKSVCIRVDGTPVKKTLYKKKARSFIIEPVAHADSKIEVAFCTGNKKCNQDCVVPKDDFLIAIGGSEDEIGDLSAPSEGWAGKKRTQDEAAIEKRSKEIRELLTVGDDSESKIFNGWAVKNKNPGCTTQVGSLN